MYGNIIDCFWWSWFNLKNWLISNNIFVDFLLFLDHHIIYKSYFFLPYQSVNILFFFFFFLNWDDRLFLMMLNVRWWAFFPWFGENIKSFKIMMLAINIIYISFIKWRKCPSTLSQWKHFDMTVSIIFFFQKFYIFWNDMISLFCCVGMANYTDYF